VFISGVIISLPLEIHAVQRQKSAVRYNSAVLR
jgi:hypothetical protein